MEDEASDGYHEECNNDGFCNVYDQTDEEEGSPPGYTRRENTEWCTCTKEQLFLACPNSFLCGKDAYPKWVLGCCRGRCMRCDRSIGGDVQLLTGLVEWECPVCMEQKDNACVFPDCPAKHSFCIECMKKLLWGVPNPRYNPDEDAEDDGEHPWEGSTTSCPTCRHRFDFLSDWSKTDRVPLMDRQRNKDP
jgi:hypothetical protein